MEFDNPFATCFVSPGRRFTSHARRPDPEVVAERFKAEGWIGQIVGPHGCGKSSLARAMLPRLQSRFGTIRSLVIRPKRWRWRVETEFTVDPGEGNSLILVDGVERLNPLQRWGLASVCRRSGFGLLVTCHRRLARLPVLARLQPSLSHFRGVVEELLQGTDLRVPEEVVVAAYRRAGGDYREALMQLYDEYQSILSAHPRRKSA